MYTQYYGLRSRPFDLSPDPRFVHWTAQHREAFCTLAYGITSHTGLTVLTGEAGTGKTTLLRSVIERLGQDVSAVSVDNPTLTRSEFTEHLAYAFGLSADARASKARLLLELRQQLSDNRAAGVERTLIVDEAQSLSDELLEEIRLLANIETPTDKLLPVVLVGQPALADRLNQPSLRQLKQRVALRCALTAFDQEGTEAYIAARVRLAGGDARRLFTGAAVALVHLASAGIPRSVNVICHNALLSGFAAETRPVGEPLIREVCREFGMPTEGPVAPLPRPTPAADAPPWPRTVERPAAVPPEVEMFRHFSERRRFSFLS